MAFKETASSRAPLHHLRVYEIENLVDGLSFGSAADEMVAAWRALKLAWDGCGWIAFNFYQSALALSPSASDYSKNVFNLSYFVLRQKLWALMEYRRKTKVGGSAPNPVVVREDDETTCRMLDAASKGRPLVLNFGSCS
ncbi:hypothetical protein HAZT_HAZT011269 [Hyalella azteca]|uniref:Iodothyronine deiodinase n=1 Tax=Hyalella azteca TaxID=294128 RepID=A0A6A0HAU5_HYAAZ|nr:hypothetical protein HAZT_HAZT011269 [Hyalella azteca]